MILKKLNQIKNSLTDISKPIKGNQVIMILENILQIRLSQSVLYSLINDGIITPTKISTDIALYTFEVNKTKASNTELLEHSLENHLNEGKEKSDKLVWSHPKDISLEKIKGVAQLYPELCLLISESKQSISIVNPFFDFGGVDSIVTYLDSALSRGVEIKMIISKAPTNINLKDMDDPFSYMVASLKSKKSRNLEIKSFSGTQETLTYSTHAKFMIFDNKYSYLGSANLTRRSLSANVELGIIASDSKVEVLVEIFEKIWNLGKDIKL